MAAKRKKPAEAAGPKAEVIRFGPQAGPQTSFCCSPADICIYGGARGGGKTWGLGLEAARHVQKPKYRGVLFRRTFPQIYQEGGLWDTLSRMYPYMGASARSNAWEFPSGATVTCHHMAEEKDWQNWLGAQLPFIGFDQLESFTEMQFFSMLACARDPYGIIRPYIRATCNPEPDTWLSRFIAWWWDQTTGYPVPERSGRVRWFIRLNDVIYWGDTKAEMERRFPGKAPTSVAFIAAFLEDNPALETSDPTYRQKLESQNQVLQERWLRGNWKIKPSAGTVFNRAWWKDKVVPSLPPDTGTLARYWDLAHTPEGEGNDPDYTASVRGKRIGNVCYITGFTRWRRTAFETEQAVRATAQADGIETAVGMEQEPSAGKSYCAYYQREVMAGFNFTPIPSLRNKVARAGPLSKALQAGSVFLVAGHWNAEFIDLLEAFRGDEEKNDVPDSASGMYNMLFGEGGPSAGAVPKPDPDRFALRGRTDRRALFG